MSLHPQDKASVLVAGGAGYIGSHTCKALAAAGYVPVTLDHLVYGHRDAVRWGPLVYGAVRGISSIARGRFRTARSTVSDT